MHLEFYKYHGAGNDFIILDNRTGQATGLTEEIIAHLCHRRFGIGADGLMCLELDSKADFRMHYYNADGKLGSLCGNGSRCIVAFAHRLGLIEREVHFLASDGLHYAEINEEGNWVRLAMADVWEVEDRGGDFVLDTGSPHYVHFVPKVAEINVFEKGRAIRYGEAFREKGINVNFVEILSAKEIKIATYERGVEDETYACGTGATAAALCFGIQQERWGKQEVFLYAKGGKLGVNFERSGTREFRNIRLSGPAKFVFRGEITV